MAEERNRKYDRQIRIWGDHGQGALEKSNVRARPIPHPPCERAASFTGQAGVDRARRADRYSTHCTRQTIPRGGFASLTSLYELPPFRRVKPDASSGGVRRRHELVKRILPTDTCTTHLLGAAVPQKPFDVGSPLDTRALWGTQREHACVLM